MSCLPTNSPNKIFSFAMLGALLFMIANFFYLAAETQCWYVEEVDPRQCNALELCGALLFVLNAIAAFMEYRQRHTMDISMSVYKVLGAEEDDDLNLIFDKLDADQAD